MKLDSNHCVFFSLLRAGLWEQDVQLSQYGDIDYREIYRLAEEQAVVGLVAAGLEYIIDTKVSQEFALNLAGVVLQLEQRNTAMNNFIGQTVEKIRDAGIYTLLVKGQGIAQCYERPLWRASGDIDFFLNDENFKKAESYFIPIASNVGGMNRYSHHIALTVDYWDVELHGSLRSGLWKRIDRTLDEVQYSIFCGKNLRIWMNGKTEIFLPRADEDVIYIFSHILEHFFKEGIGFRQICDWCRLLWTFRGNIDQKLLESRLNKMAVISEWKALASLAVDWLGMPAEAIPLYSNHKKWSRKAEKIVAFVLETGNFGHNRDYTYQKKYPFVFFKTISLYRHFQDTYKYFYIFPMDSIKIIWMRLVIGFTVALKGRR